MKPSCNNVLNADMLNLMWLYQQSLTNKEVLNRTVKLLEHTSVFIDIFCGSHTKINSMNDPHIGKLLSILHFFQNWEMEYSTHDDKCKHLITKETREDTDACIYGFVNVVKVATEHKIPLVPG